MLIGKYLYKMSKLLEHIIRKLLFEQNAKQQISTGTNREQNNAKQAGAVASFKVTSIEQDPKLDVNNPDISKLIDTEKYSGLADDTKKSTNLAWFYQKNIIQGAQDVFTKTENGGYQKLLNDGKHVVLMGNTPTGKTKFSILFWIFELEWVLQQFKSRDPEAQKKIDAYLTSLKTNKPLNILHVSAASGNFKILNSQVFTYDRLIQQYDIPNNIKRSLQKINQRVKQDVITVFKDEQQSRHKALIDSDSWPKLINETWYVKSPDDQVMHTTGNDNQTITYEWLPIDIWRDWIKRSLNFDKMDYNEENANTKPSVFNPNDTDVIGCKLASKIDYIKGLNSYFSGTQSKLFDINEWDMKFGITFQKIKIKTKLDNWYTLVYKAYDDKIFSKYKSSNDMLWNNSLTRWGTGNPAWESFFLNLNPLLGWSKSKKLVKKVNKTPYWVVRDNDAQVIFHEAGVEYIDYIVDTIKNYVDSLKQQVDKSVDQNGFLSIASVSCEETGQLTIVLTEDIQDKIKNTFKSMSELESDNFDHYVEILKSKVK